MALANENSPYFHLVVFKLLWHSLEMSQKLLRPSVLEKELTGVIMTLTYTKVLKDSWMIVEPFANDKVEDNLNPIGRMYYAASSLVCVPASLAHN
jgi:hypothetical protein